ncbi:MAG: hypothetical protein ACI841_000782 [Planctomycetota bacterium]|jgi:hypothetical protein
MNADIRTECACGDIRLAYIDGRVRTRAKGGSVHANNGFAEYGDLLAIGGDVHLTNATTEARIRTSNRNVHLHLSPGQVSVQTSGGSIMVAGIDSPTTAYASCGDV